MSFTDLNLVTWCLPHSHTHIGERTNLLSWDSTRREISNVNWFRLDFRLVFRESAFFARMHVSSMLYKYARSENGFDARGKVVSLAPFFVKSIHRVSAAHVYFTQVLCALYPGKMEGCFTFSTMACHFAFPFYRFSSKLSSGFFLPFVSRRRYLLQPPCTFFNPRKNRSNVSLFETSNDSGTIFLRVSHLLNNIFPSSLWSFWKKLASNWVVTINL